MKNLLILLTLLLGATPLLAQHKKGNNPPGSPMGASAAQIAAMEQARLTYVRGEYDSARMQFEQIVATDSHHRDAARGFLQIIQQDQTAILQAQDQYANFILPNFSVKEVPLKLAFRQLRMLAAKVSTAAGNRIEPNFVFHNEAQVDGPVTLELANVSLLAVAQQLAKLGGLEAVIRPRDIQIRPPGRY